MNCGHPGGRLCWRTDTRRNSKAVLVAVLKGFAIGLLPDFRSRPFLESGDLTPMLEAYPPPQGGLGVVRPPGDHVPRKIVVLPELLLRRFGGRGRAGARL
jgi:DNA-binding transcriptional LysR family regulator